MHLIKTHTPANLLQNDILLFWELSLQVNEVSRKGYKSRLNQYLAWLTEKEISIATVNFQDISDYKTYLLTSFSDNTAHLTLFVVCNFHKFLFTEGYTFSNPAERVKLPRIDKNFRKDAFEPAQIRKMVRALKVKDNASLTVKETAARNTAIIVLLASTGLRLKEMLSLNLGDLEVIGSSATVYVRGKGKSSKSDSVVIDSSTLTKINTYLDYRGTQAPLSSDMPLFAATKGKNIRRNVKPLGSRIVQKMVKNTMAKAGIFNDRLTVHSLRHTFGCELLTASGDVNLTSLAMRHSNLNTTMIYVKKIAQRELHKKLEGIQLGGLYE